MRAALIGTQTELAEAAAELGAWTHELASSWDEADMVRRPWAVLLMRKHSPLYRPRKAIGRAGHICSIKCRVLHGRPATQCHTGLSTALTATASWLQAGEQSGFSERNGAAPAKARSPAGAEAAASSGSSRGNTDMDSVYELLKNLSELSDALVVDAQEDDELFRKGA